MASKNIAAEFKAKIARALKSDAEQRELIGFINNRIADQRALLDCLWEFSIGFSADWDRLEKGEKHRGPAIMYRLFGRAIELAGPMNELADFVLYVAGLALESRGGKRDTRQLRPPATEAREQYVVYQSRWKQMPEQDQNVLRQKAQQKRQAFRDRRTLITEVMNAYRKKENGRTPTLEELFDFDPAPNTPRKDFDKAVKACEVFWRQFNPVYRSSKPAAEPYLKEMDVAFKELRRVLLKAGAEPLAFYQMWKWIRDGRQKKVTRTGPRGKTHLETVEPILNEIWRELYLEACYCAVRLALGKWSMFQVQKANGLSTDDRGFILQPVREGERENLAERLKWGVVNTAEFEELNRIRRRMNRFGRAAKLEHLDEFQTVALVNEIAKIQQSKPEQIEKMVVEASSQWVAFRDKFRIGQEVLDSFTIIWSDQGVAGTRVVVEFHNLAYQLFATTRKGLGDLVQKALWRKMQKLGEQVIQFLLAYLEVLGLLVDVISAGTAGGFRRIAFKFITERMREKATDEVLDAFHIKNQAVRILAGMAANLIPKPKVKGRFDAGVRDTAIGGKIHGSEPTRPVFETQGIAHTTQVPELRTRGLDNPLSGPTALPLGARGPTIVDLQAGNPAFLRAQVEAVPDSRGVAVETGDYLIHDRGAHPTHGGDLRMSRQIVQNVPDWPHVTPGTPIEKMPSTSDLTPAQLDPANVLFPQTGPVTMLRGPTGEPEAFYPARGGGRRLVPEGQADVSTLVSTTHLQLKGKVHQGYWRRPFALQKSSPELRTAMGQEINAMLRPGGFIEFRVLRSGDRGVVHEIARNIEGARIVEVNQKQIGDFLTSNGKVLPTDPIQAALLREALPDLQGQFSPLGMGTFNSIIRIYKGG